MNSFLKWNYGRWRPIDKPNRDRCAIRQIELSEDGEQILFDGSCRQAQLEGDYFIAFGLCN